MITADIVLDADTLAHAVARFPVVTFLPVPPVELGFCSGCPFEDDIDEAEAVIVYQSNGWTYRDPCCSYCLILEIADVQRRGHEVLRVEVPTTPLGAVA